MLQSYIPAKLYDVASHDSSLFVNLVLHLNCQGAHTQVKASSVAGWHQPGKLNMDDVIWSGYRPLDAINDLDMYRFLQYFGKPILQRENIKNYVQYQIFVLLLSYVADSHFIFTWIKFENQRLYDQRMYDNKITKF